MQQLCDEKQRLKTKSQKIIGVIFFLSLTLIPLSAWGSEVEELQGKISSRASDIKALEAQIAGLEKDLRVAGAQKVTLQTTLAQIELTRRKLAADITLTEKKIEETNLRLQELAQEISKKGASIEVSRATIAENARNLHELDDESIVEIILSERNLSNAMKQGATLVQLSDQLGKNISELRFVRQGLTVNKNEVESEQKKLVLLRRELTAKKSIQDANRRENLTLLSKTKGQEVTFKKLIQEKQALRTAFEAELSAYEAQLKIAIDPSRLPQAGTKALLWPLHDTRITQYFGDTDFSRSARGAVYNGRGHNGIDFAASIGTPIYSAAGGTVVGTGDTDLVCRGASYGRWVLIEHTNGLSTLYAHLSYIGVTPGQRVVSGDQIGYSGSTGYATGPHLHFTVVASQGVSVSKLKSKNPRCGTYTLPVASFNSYLNPMLFL